MILAAIKRAVRNYWVSLTIGVGLVLGLAVLVGSQGSGDGWRHAESQAQAKFARHLHAVEAKATRANARALAQQAALAHQPSSAPSSSGASRPLARAVSGGPSTGAARDPREVAQEFAMFYARVAANEDEPATAAQVKGLARALAPTCSPPSYGQYACIVHLPGRVPSTQNCVAMFTSSGSVTGRCSVGTDPAPVVVSGYVDCASVGRVVSITDPTGDEKRNAPASIAPGAQAGADPRADLLEVRVAATPTRFCADFHTAAPLSLGSWLTLDVNQQNRPDLHLEPTINYRRSPLELESPVNTPVAGQIGTAGDWSSLVMTTGNVSAPLPHQPFQFRAYAAHEDAVPGVVDLTADTTPDAPRYATYP